MIDRPTNDDKPTDGPVHRQGILPIRVMSINIIHICTVYNTVDRSVSQNFQEGRKVPIFHAPIEALVLNTPVVLPQKEITLVLKRSHGCVLWHNQKVNPAPPSLDDTACPLIFARSL